MAAPVLVEAVRTPIGRRGGALAGTSPVELLRDVQVELLRRAGLTSSAVDQVVGGCVTQIGEQALNVTRNAWLSAGFDPAVGCTTVDVSCGSAQQANHIVASLVAGGAIDAGIACGVESMSRVELGSNVGHDARSVLPADYPWDEPGKGQWEAADRIAQRHGFTRQQLDEYGARSQQRAAAAWDEGRFDAEVMAVAPRAVAAGDTAAAADEKAAPAFVRDEGLRATEATVLAGLKTTLRDGLHTAATTSQVSDGAAAVLWMSEERAAEAGLATRARLIAQTVTGADPYYLLDGPIAATRRILDRYGLHLDDIDLYEVNEAFAAIPMAWADTYGADLERLNVNGGAIALGHPLGATGCRLLVSALHELERSGRRRALVTMCCGGSLGTASVLERA